MGKGYLEDTRKGIVSNTFEQIERIIVEVGQAHGTVVQSECYDISHMYTLAHFLDRKLLTPPLFVQSIFGLLGCIAPTRRTCCTWCCISLTAFSATTTSGRSWPPASIRWAFADWCDHGRKRSRRPGRQP